jgi:hypothetical protein
MEKAQFLSWKPETGAKWAYEADLTAAKTGLYARPRFADRQAARTGAGRYYIIRG